MEIQNEEDHDHVDYSQAQRHELTRHNVSQEVLQTAKFYSRDKVRTGFITDEEYQDVKGKDIVFDVLPSFEMYQSVQNRSQDPPMGPSPDYFGYPSEPPRIDTTANDTVGDAARLVQSPSESVSAASSASRNSMSSYSTQSSSLEHYGPLSLENNVLDNAHKLPTMQVHPGVTVDIYVTKNVPVPHEKSENESMLKEYTSGDGVYGYVVISNMSNDPVSFRMFTVTLEGITSIVDAESKKIYNKRFLNMVDMNASWTFACISPSTNVQYTPGVKDAADGCILGFNKDRILEPHTKYKKFFYFKVPYTLLDNTCRHQQELHTLLPPSLGIDRYNKKNKHANITLNPALHYGHNGTRGSPVLTKDLSNGNLSVSYRINATLIGCHPTLKDIYGQPEYAVMRSAEYALRFIPFGFSVSLFSSKRALETLKLVIESSFKNAKRCLKLNEDGSEEEVRLLDQEVKMQQLNIGEIMRNDSSNTKTSSFPLRNQNFATPDFSKVETSMVLVANPKKSIFGKAPKDDLNESGIVEITTRVPKDGLSYVSPPLIRKVNKVSTLNDIGMQNIDSLTNTLSMNEKKVLTNLEFELKFKPSDFTLKSGFVPEISQITSSLLVVNIYSKSAIPIKLSSDIIVLHHGDEVTALDKMKKDFQCYNQQFEQLKTEFESKGLDINKYVDHSTQADIRAMKDLRSDMFTVNALKNKLDPSSSTKWVKNSDGTMGRKVKLMLEYHDLITETLIPNFQTCLLSRIYCIQVTFKFKNCSQVGQVRVPIRLRWFDNE